MQRLYSRIFPLESRSFLHPSKQRCHQHLVEMKMTNVPEKSPKFDQIKTRIVLDKQGPDLSLYTKPIYRRILSLNLMIEKKKKPFFYYETNFEFLKWQYPCHWDLGIVSSTTWTITDEQILDKFPTIFLYLFQWFENWLEWGYVKLPG